MIFAGFAYKVQRCVFCPDARCRRGFSLNRWQFPQTTPYLPQIDSMRQDYKYVLTARAPQLSHGATHPYQRGLKKALPWALGVSVLLTLLALLLPSKSTEASVETPVKTLETPQVANLATTDKMRIDLVLPNAPEKAAKPPVVAAKNPWQQMKIEKGDTFGHRAQALGISAADIARLSANEDIGKHIAKVHPGQVINFKLDPEGQLQALAFDITETSRLSAQRGEDGFAAHTIERPFTERENRASGVVNSSLYAAARNSGMSDNVVMQLAQIFGYDIDFSLDVREGDRFNVIWNEYHRDGEKVKDGDILAAEYINNGRVVRAVRFTDAEGRTDYFTPEGKSLKKAFIRSPVHFTRISSRFDLSRLHPLFKTVRPHRGVDYAAPTGTPIFASGEGKVIFRGQKKGYGNVIILRHPGNRYTTLYAHMSKFNSKATLGKHVEQGQVIGYVGQTGYATGPHLHYEFRVNNKHVDPLTVKLPTAEPLNKKYMPSFKQANNALLEQLNLMSRTQLAQLGK